jgi:endogenous inhibitor of DNA gyrase (YacG/DUF329 family)
VLDITGNPTGNGTSCPQATTLEGGMGAAVTGRALGVGAAPHPTRNNNMSARTCPRTFTSRRVRYLRTLRYGSRMSTVSTCPTCKGPRKALPENPAFPFCSRRCKLADLSNWFNERYAVPDESTMPSGDEDEREPPKRPLN